MEKTTITERFLEKHEDAILAYLEDVAIAEDSPINYWHTNSFYEMAIEWIERELVNKGKTTELIDRIVSSLDGDMIADYLIDEWKYRERSFRR